MKATEQYFLVVLFINYAVQGGSLTLWKKILKWLTIQMKAVLRAVFSCGAVYYPVQGGSNFWACEWNP